MTLAVRDTVGPQMVTTVEVRDAASVAERVDIIQIRDASGVAKTVFESMSASAAPPNLSGFGNSSSAIDITTGAATVTVTGGVAPFTYLWTNTGGWTVGAPTAATTNFTAVGVSPFTDVETTAKCTVTDASGNSVDTNDVVASVSNLGGS